MKRAISILLATLLCLGLLSGCLDGGGDTESEGDDTAQDTGEAEDGNTGGDDGEQIVLKFAELLAPDHPHTIAVYDFADIVAEMSDGRIVVEVYHSGQLGEGREAVQALQMGGGVDFFRESCIQLADYGMDKVALFGLPYVFRDRDHMWEVLNSEIGQEILQDPQESGTQTVGLFYLDEGARYILTTEPVADLDELAGKKIRVPESDAFVSVLNALGASATPMAYAELYSALQTGIVDGMENPLPSIMSGQYYEVAKYLLMSNHVYTPSMVIMSELTWNSLSPGDRQILLDAGDEAAANNRANVQRLEDEMIQLLEENGVTITYVDDYGPYEEAVAPVIEKYGSEFSDMVDRIRGM